MSHLLPGPCHHPTPAHSLCAPQYWNTCWEAASSSGTWPRGLLMGHRGLLKYAAGSCGRGHTFTLQAQHCLSPVTSSSPVFLCKGNLVTNKASSLESGLTLNLEQRRVCLSPLGAHCICGLYFLIGFNSVFLFLAATTGCLEGVRMALDKGLSRPLGWGPGSFARS